MLMQNFGGTEKSIMVNFGNGLFTPSSMMLCYGSSHEIEASAWQSNSLLTPGSSIQLQSHGNTRSPSTWYDANVTAEDCWVDRVCLDGQAVSVALECL